VRAKFITQLTSQVSPPSGEKLCSHPQVVAVTSDQRNRTRIGFASGYPTRVKFITQLTSQVAPPSGEQLRSHGQVLNSR
jgi:hypothetical protein